MRKKAEVKKKEKVEKDKLVKEKPIKEKKEHSKGYVLRKNTVMKVLRVVVWVMLTFIFIRGVLDIFEPEKDDEVKQLIQNFKEEYSEFSNQNAEVMSFAQNFVREYLTYEARKKDDYNKRLKPYVSTSMLNSEVNDLSKSATAIYVQAYRIEEYSSNQMDVYVLAEVEYTTRILEEDGQTYTERKSLSQMELSVPVYVKDGFYVVENVPLMVSDTVNLEKYSIEDYYGTSVDSTKTEAIETSVTNFLKAYYEQEDSVINYYLSPEADKSKFTGLRGRFKFLEIDSILCYQGVGGEIIGIVKYQIQDAENEAMLLQEVNLSIKESGGKYYINSMGARTGNLQNVY